MAAFLEGPVAVNPPSLPRPVVAPLLSRSRISGTSAPGPAVSAAALVTGAVIASSRHRRRTASAVLPVAAAAAAAAAVKAAAAAASVAGAAAGVIEAKNMQVLQHKSGRRPKVVVIGSGWGAASFIKGLSEAQALMYDITLVSQRNHFLYTPLLPTCTMGSIEERSIMTPIRVLITGKADFLEAKVEHIDTVRKVIRCCRTAAVKHRSDPNFNRFDEHAEDKLEFFLDYDILVYAVGAETNDFNCPGVKDNALFFREVNDARKVRERISDAFEEASLPSITAEQRDALLSFVIVGGGPTGVEVAADLADFVQEDCARQYPKLFEHVKIQLINTGEHLLSTYSRDISAASFDVFQKKGVEVLSGCMVTEVTATEVKMKTRTGNTSLPHSCVVWCAGIKENRLNAQLKASLAERHEILPDPAADYVQLSSNGIVSDEWLQVKGSAGTIFALGDASSVQQDRAFLFAEELFSAGDIDGNGELDLKELKQLFQKASASFPQFEDYAQYLEEVIDEPSNDDPRIAALVDIFGRNLERERRAWRQAWELTHQRVGDRTVSKEYEVMAQELEKVDVNHDKRYSLSEFKNLLRSIDQNLRSFPPTAQVAAQQGKYLAELLADGRVAGDRESFLEASQSHGPFTYFHKGSLAYLGGGSAAFDLPVIGPVTGTLAGLAWKAYETSAQMSWKNRALVGMDWIKSEVFGRDTSRV